MVNIICLTIIIMQYTGVLFGTIIIGFNESKRLERFTSLTRKTLEKILTVLINPDGCIYRYGVTKT